MKYKVIKLPPDKEKEKKDRECYQKFYSGRSSKPHPIEPTWVYDPDCVWANYSIPK